MNRQLARRLKRRSMTGKKRLIPTAQEQTLSIRVGDATRHRLERIRALRQTTTRDPVSISQIAKELLESGREDRLGIVMLLAHPTDTLLEIRRKGEAQQLLSRDEWCVLAHFVRRGVEAFSSHTPHPASPDGILAVLDAFLAAYDSCTSPREECNALYVGNLPAECRPVKVSGSGRGDSVSSEVVRQTVMETRRQVSNHNTHGTSVPVFAARNLSLLLEDEMVADPESLHRALRPHWSALWRLAARGHYVTTHEPVRRPSPPREPEPHFPIASITEGPFMVSFARDGCELSVLLSFPGALGPRYPIRRYPAIVEFRAMLSTLASGQPTASWNGAHFAGSIANAGQSNATWSFCAHNNGITFKFSEPEWRSMDELLQRAWEVSDVRAVWDGLVLDYGEL